MCMLQGKAKFLFYFLGLLHHAFTQHEKHNKVIDEKKKKNIKTCIQVVCSLINDLGLYTHEVTLVIMDFIRHLTFHIYI